MNIDAETLKREWSTAIVRWWFLPLLAAALAGAVAYPVAMHFNPPRAQATTYIYMPHHDAEAFEQAIQTLPGEIARVADPHSNLYLVLTAPGLDEARERLLSVRAMLEAIAIASLAATQPPVSTEAEEWVQKLKAETVSSTPIGGGGEASSVAIAWAFMLSIAGIVFARSLKYDLAKN